MNQGNVRREELRIIIERFLQERRDAKLEKLKDDDTKHDEKRDELFQQHQFSTWIEDAARRVSQIQAVTHSLKAIHPDAKGSSLYCQPRSLIQHEVVGSHNLPDDFSLDVVGNAAALDVYKFLKLECEGRTMLELAQEENVDFLAALSQDESQARLWMAAFAALVNASDRMASHTQAKQVFWLTGDDPLNDADYHLLGPLYASSLAHQVFQTINEDRFGEAAKEAREMRRAGKYHAQGYHDYPDMAVQKMGGTKPQNISQLNSERGGNNYLFASLPPLWKSSTIRPPLHTDSVFQSFGSRKEVRRVVNELGHFLAADPAKTMATRDRRDDLTGELLDQLHQYAAELHTLEPGWSASPGCDLVPAEKLWLDPRRAQQDPIFSADWKKREWTQEVRHRFANWLNAQLGKKAKLPVGDVEHAHWSHVQTSDEQLTRQLDENRHWLKQLEKELDTLQEELADE